MDFWCTAIHTPKREIASLMEYREYFILFPTIDEMDKGLINFMNSFVCIPFVRLMELTLNYTPVYKLNDYFSFFFFFFIQFHDKYSSYDTLFYDFLGKIVSIKCIECETCIL